MPSTAEIFWHIPILVTSLFAAFVLVFHPIAGPLAYTASRDEMEAQLLAKASIDTFSVLLLGVVLSMAYAGAVRLGLLPELVIQPTFFDLSMGMLLTLFCLRSILMSHAVEPLDDEGEVTSVAPVSLGTLSIGGVLLLVTALFAGVTLGEGPREVDAVTAAALETCGEGNIARVSIDPGDYGFDCK